MSGPHIPELPPGARQIPRDSFAALVAAARGFFNIRFNPQQFNVRWHGFTPAISLRKTVAGGGISMPFDVTLASATTVDVAAGSVKFAGTWTDKSAVTGLDCSAGTSTDGYVYLTLTRSTGAVSAPTYAVSPTETDNVRVKYIATISKDAEGNISSVQQGDRGWLDTGEEAEKKQTRHTVGIGSVSAGASVDASQTDSWDITNQPSGKQGVTIRFHRTSYNSSGDQVLHGQYWDMTWDGSGRLVAVTAETEYTIDTPELCS